MLEKIREVLITSTKSSRKIIFIISFLFFSPITQADDVDDVMEVVHRWAELESNLEAQAQLVREDRVQIAGGIRQTDQAKNLEVQLANHNARVREQGGEPEMIVRIESPLVRIYGDTAVVSFIRLFNVIPHNQPPSPVGTAWFSMVLVKENNEWGIAHHHVSPAGVD